MEKKRFTRFSEFYPFYLSEHQDRVNRRLHFVGSTLVIALVLFAPSGILGTLRERWLKWLP